MNRAKITTRITLGMPTTKANSPTRQRCSIEHHTIDSKNFGIFVNALSGKHVALHPRFSGQHDELNEQFDKSAGWMHAYGRPTGQHGTPTPGAVGTNSCNVYSSPDRDQIYFLLGSLRSSIGTHQVRTSYSVCPKRRITCTYAPTQQEQKIGNQEWLVKQNKR